MREGEGWGSFCREFQIGIGNESRLGSGRRLLGYSHGVANASSAFGLHHQSAPCDLVERETVAVHDGSIRLTGASRPPISDYRISMPPVPVPASVGGPLADQYQDYHYGQTIGCESGCRSSDA
jgi:hypothetical protein